MTSTATARSNSGHDYYVARRSSTCALCEAVIIKGEKVVARGRGNRVHTACLAAQSPWHRTAPG